MLVNSSIDSYDKALKKAAKANNSNSKSPEDLPVALESEQELKRKSTKNKKYFEKFKLMLQFRMLIPKNH